MTNESLWQCADVDECAYDGACAPGAICTNVPGGHHCACPPGFDGDPLLSGCADANECARDPCGRNALCSNMPGSFKCACPPGSIGDPMHSCTGKWLSHPGILYLKHSLFCKNVTTNRFLLSLINLTLWWTLTISRYLPLKF